MSERITFKNGHTLTLQLAPFQRAFKLFQTICREVKAAGVDISGLDLKKLGDVDVNEVKDGILHLLASEALAKVVFETMDRCTIEKEGHSPEGIRPETFEPEDMRGDFFPIAWEVIKANVAPFFGNLDLLSSTPAAGTASGPRK